MYPSDGVGVTRAQAFCAECSLRARCGEIAILANEDEGVWAGLSQRKRQEIRKTLSIGPNAVRIASQSFDHPVRILLRAYLDQAAGLTYGTGGQGRPSNAAIHARATLEEKTKETLASMQSIFDREGWEFVIPQTDTESV